MRMHYVPLFSIECRHDHFADQHCKHMSLRPTASCLRLMEQYQCIFRPAPDGGMVASATRDSLNFMEFYTEKVPFSFELISADPYMVNYTDVATMPTKTEAADTVYYFNNLEDHSAEIQGSELRLLHPASQALTQKPLPVYPRRFSHIIQAAPEGGELTVLDMLHGEAVWQTPLLPGSPNVMVDLSMLPEGCYKLHQKGQDDVTFYLSDASSPGRWGVVEIFPGGVNMSDRVPENYRVIDDAGRALNKRFSLYLNKRSTIWRYFIFNSSPDDHTYDSYRIVGSEKRAMVGEGQQSQQFSFTEGSPVMVDGRRARVFESDQPIPLLERPGDEYEFSFKNNGQGERGGRPFKLPYAKVDNSRLEEVEGKRRMCSEIYVYL